MAYQFGWEVVVMINCLTNWATQLGLGRWCWLNYVETVGGTSSYTIWHINPAKVMAPHYLSTAAAVLSGKKHHSNVVVMPSLLTWSRNSQWQSWLGIQLYLLQPWTTQQGTHKSWSFPKTWSCGGNHHSHHIREGIYWWDICGIRADIGGQNGGIYIKCPW